MSTKVLPSLLLIAGPMTAGAAAPEPTAPLQLDPETAEVVLARTSSRVVTATDLQERVATDPLSARGNLERQLRARLEALVIDQELERRFVGRGGLEDPEYRSWSTVLERDLAARALDRELAREATAVAAKEPPAKVELAPARWRLRNLFIARPPGADPAEAARRRALIETLHQRLVNGEDFGELARTHSESQTRIRDGRLGFVTLDRLEPVVAAAVRDLRAGELTSVLETSDGWTILLAEAFVPEGPRPRAVDQQREDALRKHLETLHQQTEESARKALSPTALSITGDDPHAVIVRFADGTTITALELDFFRRHRGIDAPADAVASSALTDAAISCALKAAASRERGLIATPTFRATLDRKLAELRAELELQRLAAPMLEAPRGADVDQLYTENLGRLQRPPRYHLRSVQLPLDGLAVTKDLVRRFSEIAARAVAGAVTVESLAQASDEAELIDHGWRTPHQIFPLGKAIDSRFAPKGADTSESTRPGVVFGPVQEGRRLLVVEILGREAARPLTRAEAEPSLVRAAWEGARRTAEAKVRRQLLEAVQFTVDEAALARLASRWATAPAPGR